MSPTYFFDRMKQRRTRLALAALAGLFGASFCRGGSVVTDGTVGARTTLNGPVFNIPASLGQQKGANLFHSFGTFNLTAGQTASFSGPSNVSNVIARVTGGGASGIDGTIQCTIPNANFYLINPAGVVFGPNAALDVKGSFIVTTADYLKLADANRFNATHPTDSVLTSSAPAAFGFLAKTPAAIQIIGSELTGPDGKAMSFVGGGIQITGGFINTTGGRVNLISTASPGVLTFDAASLLATIDLTPTPPTLGDISLDEDTGIQTDGPAGGRVSVRGRNFDLNGSAISAATTNSQTGRGMDIVISGNLSLLDSEILTDSHGTGKSGPINVVAHAITIDSQGDETDVTGITAQGSDAAGGNITVQVGTLNVIDGGVISSETSGTAAAGNLTVNATTITLDSKGSDVFTGLFTATEATGHGGAAGTLSVQGTSLTVQNGAQTCADTSDSGHAGTVDVSVAKITIDGKGIDRTQDPTGLSGTGIFARAIDPTQSAAAGTININAATSLSVVRGAAISAESDGNGQSGSVTVTGGSVALDDHNLGIFTGIFVESSSSRSGASNGQVTINVDSLTLSNGAFVSATTFGAADAGGISITTAHALTLGGQSPEISTAISAATYGSGNGGSIRIQTDTTNLGLDSAVGAGTFSSGRGGAINLTANTLTLNGGTIETEATPVPMLLHGGAMPGDGGIITVNAGTLSLTNGGTLNAGTSGPGNGGRITVAANILTADGAGTESNTGINVDSAPNSGNALGIGAAGTIDVSAGTLTLLNGASISASTLGSGAGGNISVTVGGALSIDGGTSDLLTGILTTAAQQGTAGDITVVAGSIGLANKSQITSSASGTGSAGNINVTADAMQITTGGGISSDTGGSGAGGDVAVHVTGAVLIDGQNMPALTGITANSTSTSNGGNAGQVTVDAGALTLQNTGRIATNTFGLGLGGTINVTANTILLNEAPSDRLTGITSLSESPGAGGRGGDVNVTAATSLHISNGARISTETLGLGDGGTITVSAGSILIDNPGDEIAGGIVADSDSLGAGGRAGNIFVTTNSLKIQSTGEISSGTFGLGAGSNITVNASQIVLDANGFNPATIALYGQSLTGINTASESLGAGGQGGNIDITADSIQVLHGAAISSGTFGLGAGGSINVTAASVIVSGTLSGDLTVPSTIISATEATGMGGDGGGITIHAASVGLFNAGEINSQTDSSGAAGPIMLTAQRLQLDGSAALVSASNAMGTAAPVNINISDSLTLTRQSTINTTAQTSSGGDITIFAGRSLSLTGKSSITAQSGGDGGKINVTCPGIVDLADSFILTRAGANGGDMVVDPSFVILQNSQLSANGGINGGNITVRPDTLLESQSSITATGARGVSGTLQVTPDYSLTGAILSLPTSLSDNLTLQPQCAADLPGAVSSFIVTGRGGAPLQPGGWSADLDLRLPTTRPR